MLLRTVSLNSTVSWVTTPICERSEARVVSRTSRPSISKAPEVTSKKRGIRCTSVLLPAPLERTRRDRLEIRPGELPCSLAEADYLPCLHAEGFDDSIAGDGFVQDILNIGKLVLPATRSVPHPPANLPR